MILKRHTYLIGILFLIVSCTQQKDVIIMHSSEGHLWQPGDLADHESADGGTYIIERNYEQVIDGFGAVFNELGYDALNMVEEEERKKILEDFYSEEGCNFTICRMPIGANDYARDWYSLNDHPGDFSMEHFSIERDLTTLIPYIREAMEVRPDLVLWGSPWCPPVWMKVNSHYACRSGSVNDLSPGKQGREDHTQFIMEKKYLEAYALYFVNYIKAYREQGIDIWAVHVQNEPNSCQNFPSCIWTAEDLNTFIGQYLGPAFDAHGIGTEIWYGTIERPFIEKVDTVLQDPDSKKYVKGVGFQWAGKACIPLVHEKYPEMKLMQTESECGNGSNDWAAAEYTWSLVKHYLENGANVYTYWNTILDETGRSMWGWKQNSLLSVHSETGEVQRNPEFYLMKHLGHFVLPGARKLKTPAGLDAGLVFENPDGDIVLLIVHTEDSGKTYAFTLGNDSFALECNAHSINTLVIQK